MGGRWRWTLPPCLQSCSLASSRSAARKPWLWPGLSPRPVQVNRFASPLIQIDKQRFWQPDGTVPDSETATALKQKQSLPLMLGVARIGVTAASNRSARRLLRRIEGSWHEAPIPRCPSQASDHQRDCRGPGDHSTIHAAHHLAEQLQRRRAGRAGRDRHAGDLGTGVGLGRQSAPFCLASYPHRGHDPGRLQLSRAVASIPLDLQGGLRGIHVVGPTGSGKSWLLIQMVLQDIAAGRSTLVLDPKGRPLAARF